MNSDYDQRVLIQTEDLPWESTGQSGVFKKTLSSKEHAETALIELKPNAVLNSGSILTNTEIFVLEGTYINEYGTFAKGTYLRLPREDESLVRSTDGCVIFRKANYFEDDQSVVVETFSSPWLIGHGNLQVMPLHDQTALVKWPLNERFIPHKHWGGEEIFVLQGTFMDEHGHYPVGSWIRSPHLSTHFPYVEEETIIWVKTGHL